MKRLIPLLLLIVAAGPATQPAEPKPFVKVEEILAKLPKDARPEKGQWNQFNTPRANEQLKDIMAGRRIEAAFPLDAADAEKPVTEKENPDKVLRWNVTVTISDSPIRFEGAAGRLKVVTAGGEPFYIYADEKTARAAKAWRRGDAVTIGISEGSLRVESRDAVTDEGKATRENVYTLTVSSYYLKQVGGTKIPPMVLTPEEKAKLGK